MQSTAARVRAALSSLLFLSACAGVGQGERYAALRDGLSREESQSAANAARDPFAGASALSRAALVSAALERNPSLDAAREAWRAALARYPQETALRDPTFSYGLRPASLGSSQVDAAQDFSLAQELPFPGKLALRGERALAEADAAQGDLEVARIRIAALASTLFDRYWLAARELESNAAHTALLGEARRAALSRYASGGGSQAEVLALETEQAMLLHREIELGTERRLAAARIDALLHRDPELALPEPPEELELAHTHDTDLPRLVARALEQRPELRAAAARVRARESDVALARREFLPDFTLRAAYEGTWQEDPLKPLVGVELNLPLELERRRAALEEADARLASEKSRARRLEDQVRLEVASAVERQHESQHLLELSRERLLPAARERAAGARASFAAGRASFLELVDAERALRSAEQAEFEAREGLSERRAELARALGETAGLEKEP